MKTKSSNKKNIIVLLLVMLVLAVLAVVYVLSTIKPSLELSADRPAYFPVDEPVVTLSLINQKDGADGSIVVTKSDARLTVKEITAAKGVTYRELDNDIIFTLSNEYFTDYKPEIAQIKFTNNESGKYELKFNVEKTEINVKNGKMNISLYKNAEIKVGLVSTDEPQQAASNSGTPFGV
ncbi:hypothetical protein JW911_02235 [Candidatus Peregrinibacteria bacterium]|nr:hypothetical protein [Candidatus Peregrinibacteria bacterium]